MAEARLDCRPRHVTPVDDNFDWDQGGILWQDHVVYWMKTPLSMCKNAFRQLFHTRWYFLIFRVVQCALAAVFLIPSALLSMLGSVVAFASPRTPRMYLPAILERPKHPRACAPWTARAQTIGQLSAWQSSTPGTGTKLPEQTSTINRKADNGNFTYREIRRLLQNVVYRLESQPGKRPPVLKHLNDNLHACDPTWLNAATDAFHMACGTNGPKNELLLMLQQVKTDLISGIMNNSQWHMLTYVRMFRGRAWGLREPSWDGYAFNYHSNWTLSRISDAFMSAWTIDNVVGRMRNKILEKYPGWGDMAGRSGLITLLKAASGIEEADTLMNTFFTVEDTGEGLRTSINKKGVLALLQAIGQVK